MRWPLHQVTIDVPDCPTVTPNVGGIPSWVVGWGFGITAVLVLALIVGVAVVRYKRHEEITDRQRNRQRALVDAATLVKHCPGCGMDYSIEEKLKAAGP